MTTRRFICLLVPVAALVAGAAFALAPQSADADWMTTAKVKLGLLEKLGADALEIHVETTEGVVHLTGDVEKRESRELAPRIAESVAGVSSVDNDLRLEPSGAYGGSKTAEAEAEVKDAMLEMRVRIALIDALGTDGFAVGTEAANGMVVLEFAPEAAKEMRSRAVKVVRALEGVEKVTTTTKS